MTQVIRDNVLLGLDEKGEKLLKCKLKAAPTMDARSRAHWTLPHKLTLEQAHAFLQTQLAKELNKPEKALRARLKVKLATW